MTVETLPAPSIVDQSDDDIIHIYCCDPDRSLCGLDISGEEETDDGICCPLCLLVDGPCGAVDCPDRVA